MKKVVLLRILRGLLRVTSHTTFLLLFLLTFISFASAKTHHITLLTIGEIGGDTVGGTADAFLEIKHGRGRIFLDSFPLSKIDTQISTRYANEIACDYLDMDCSAYDFFYTIRAGSTIVGGPSASAPLTILTIAALKNLELRNDTVMTGTINSGGSIGPVGGVVKKALAAEKAGFKRVLIPMFTISLEQRLVGSDEININATNNTNNTSPNITRIINNGSGDTARNNTVNDSIKDITEEEFGIEEANLSIEVIKVSNIEEALAYFTDIPVRSVQRSLEVPPEYTSTMREVASKLCKRALDLYNRTRLVKDEDINKSEEYISNIKKGFEHSNYYSAASYCFSLGVLARKANLKELEEKNPSRIRELYNVLWKAINEFDHNLERINLTSLAQLETYIIVKERLFEAKDSLVRIANNITADELAYAIERYYSAVYWSDFFRIKGKRVELDAEYLQEACYKKLSEAEERLNYASLYVPPALQNSRNTIKQAYAFALEENYKMCLFKASFAKAESNLLLSTIAVGKNQLDELTEEKLKAVEKVILKEQSRGGFPILGYSYYEYATSLKENNDVVSGLVFAEYALELSNIEIYFPKKSFFPKISLILLRINYPIIMLFASAFILGLATGIFLTSRITRKKTERRKKQQKQQRKKTKKKKR